MWFVWDNKGWTFLLMAILLAGIGSAIHFGLGVGFLTSAAGFFFSAFIAAVTSNH